uniref:Uncharacterized protein n=1 Tax=Ditylenchus dipsaci TaxID=166011 RepID=A0A915D5K2_9BILA
MEEVLPVTRREEEKPIQSLKIPKLKIKMMHKEGASTSSSQKVSDFCFYTPYQQQPPSSSAPINFSSTQDSNLTLKIRPLKPPSSKSPKKVSPKNHALSENRPMAQNPYTNSLTSAFQMEVNPLCAPLLNGNHALPAFGGLSAGLNASRERVQFSPCDDDPEDDRLRSQTSQLLTKLIFTLSCALGSERSFSELRDRAEAKKFWLYISSALRSERTCSEARARAGAKNFVAGANSQSSS